MRWFKERLPASIFFLHFNRRVENGERVIGGCHTANAWARAETDVQTRFSQVASVLGVILYADETTTATLRGRALSCYVSGTIRCGTGLARLEILY